MFLLPFVEALPLLVNEQVLGGVQVRTGLSECHLIWVEPGCLAVLYELFLFFHISGFFANGIWNAVTPLLEQLVPEIQVCYLF